MRIPLFKRMRKQTHRDVAELQDRVLETVCALEEKAVLHGGTAVWRCYEGNRFSEDLDFYLKLKKGFREDFAAELGVLGAELRKYKQTANSVYANVVQGRTRVAFEAALRVPAKPVLHGYEKTDGGLLDIYTLSPEELLLEKLAAFKSRKCIRDLYDVWHLSRFVDNGLAKKGGKELAGLPKAVDEKKLRALVLTGAVPSHAQMVSALQRRFSA